MTGSAGGKPDAAGSSTKDFLAQAEALRGLVEGAAVETEQGGTLAIDVVEALKATELFWMTLPQSLGGGGAGVIDMMLVTEALARADGSTGWTFMANVSATAAAAAYCGAEAVEVIFGGGRRPVLAGMLGPAGKARAAPGGFEVGGRFSFGSGCGHADWFGAGMLVMDGGAPRRLTTGEPEVRVCFLPRENIQVLGNWNVSGLVGTGSYDYLVPDQFVGAGFTFERSTVEPVCGGPLFRLGLAAIGAAGHAAVALGLMRRALEEVVALAGTKKRPGYPDVIATRDLFKAEFARREASYHATRAYVLTVFADAERSASAGDEVSVEQRARLRQATTWAHEVAAEIVRFAHAWAGSEAIRTNTAIGRVSRDMAVATQHVFVDPQTLIDAAPAILARWG